MKSQKLVKDVILFSFDNRKEMTLSFCRLQEYYESPIPALFRKKFTLYDFLNESMKKNGEINYFSYWSGFNVPGEIVNEWWELHGLEATPAEKAIFDELTKHKIDFHKPFYIIGALKGDKRVVKHEIAHGLYYTNKTYQARMSGLTLNLHQHYPKIYNKVKKKILKMGYNESVVSDEMQAYLSSETPKYLKDVFDLDIKGVPQISEMRKVLLEYNTFKYTT